MKCRKLQALSWMLDVRRWRMESQSTCLRALTVSKRPSPKANKKLCICWIQRSSPTPPTHVGVASTIVSVVVSSSLPSGKRCHRHCDYIIIATISARRSHLASPVSPKLLILELLTRVGSRLRSTAASDRSGAWAICSLLPLSTCVYR